MRMGSASRLQRLELIGLRPLGHRGDPTLTRLHRHAEHALSLHQAAQRNRADSCALIRRQGYGTATRPLRP